MLYSSLFNYWLPSIQEGSYFLSSISNNISGVIYTKRSLERESSILNKLLLEVSKKQNKLIWVAPFHIDIVCKIEKQLLTSLVWVDIATFTEVDTNIDFTYINSADVLYKYILEIEAQDKFIIQNHAFIKDTYFLDLMNGILLEVLNKAALRLKTVFHFNNIWQYNYRRNKEIWKKCKSIQELVVFSEPKYFILGGPSANIFLDTYLQNSNLKGQDLWCADTAFMSCILRGIIPKVVFSIDAGFGSYEHFSYVNLDILKNICLVLDPLSFPLLYNKSSMIYTYSNTNPLLIDEIHQFPRIENKTGDVYGLMEAVNTFLYQHNKPEIIGYDQKSISYVTHLRGSGYYMRQYTRNNRFITIGNYFYELSKRYSK